MFVLFWSYKCHLGQNTTKILVSLNKDCIFEHYRRVQTIKDLLIDIILLVNFLELPPIGLC
jgi:hypothetical protein